MVILEQRTCGYEIRYTYLQPMFVSMTLEAEITPRQACECLGGFIVNKNKEAKCKPILDWIKVALTQPSHDQQSRLATAPLTAPLSNCTLMEHQWKLVVSKIPDLDPIASRGGAQIGLLVN